MPYLSSNHDSVPWHLNAHESLYGNPHTFYWEHRQLAHGRKDSLYVRGQRVQSSTARVPAACSASPRTLALRPAP